MWELYVQQSKVKVTSYYRPWRPLRENRGIAVLLFVNLVTLDEGGWSTPRPGHLYPGKDPVPIVQETGWASEPVWIGAENLAPTGIRSPDLPARSYSLYRLSHPGFREFYIKREELLLKDTVLNINACGVLNKCRKAVALGGKTVWTTRLVLCDAKWEDDTIMNSFYQQSKTLVIYPGTLMSRSNRQYMYVQGNIEARSRNHSCSGKSINIKYKVVQIWPGLFVCKQVTVCPGHIWTTLYNECVFLPQFFCMQNARFLRRILLSSLVPLDVLYFSTVAHKPRNFLGGGGNWM